MAGYRMGAAVLAVAAGWAVGPAAAATCTEQVAEFARDHDLTISAPMRPEGPLTDAPPGGSALEGRDPERPTADLGRRLAESGGVIAPPPVRDPAVIEPPPTASRMPTAPAVDPDMAPVPPSATPAVPAPLGPTARAQTQALLDSALAAAQSGDDARCLEGLAKAGELVTQASTGRPG